MTRPGIPIMDRVWSRINKDGPIPTHMPELGQCWEWLGPPNGSGYGTIKVNGVALGVHVVVYTLEYGDTPKDHLVMHICDNRICARPSHLKSGTNSENLLDASSKGHYVGNRGKFNPYDVEDIRALVWEGWTYTDVARVYDVSVTTISRVINHWQKRYV